MRAADLIADIDETLRRFTPFDESQEGEREQWLSLLGDDAPLWRTHHPGHFTASALPIDPSGERVCLVHHTRIDLWVQPGGHLEGEDDTLVAAAGREMVEETGLTGSILPEPVMLSRHRAPCGATWHLDFEFVAVTDSDVVSMSEESHDVAWFSIDRLPAGIAPGVDDLVARVAARMQ